MRDLFTWLMVFSVLAGSWSRVLAMDPCELKVQHHLQQHAGHHHHPNKPCNQDHDQNCPLEHHQCGACDHVMPLTDDMQDRVTVNRTVYSLFLRLGDVLIVPDEPVAELDKPPLI